LFFVFASSVGPSDICSVDLILEQNTQQVLIMKNLIIVLQILLAASCTRTATCLDSRLTCTHVIYYTFLACSDPKIPNKWKFSNCKSYEERTELTACDTSAWLAETRLIDSVRTNNPENPTWEAFALLYPNECGCR